jgi:hypothetical protein
MPRLWLPLSPPLKIDQAAESTRHPRFKRLIVSQPDGDGDFGRSYAGQINGKSF